MKFFPTSLLVILAYLFIAGVLGHEAKGAPVINNMAPNPVPGKSVDQAVGIFGSGFVSGSALKVRVKWPTGQTDLQGSQVNFASSTQLTIFINVGTSAANWTAQVINPNGDLSNVFGFAVTAAAPTISSVSPGSYPPSNSNQTMTINGSNFLNGATLTFDPPTGSNINSTASKLTFVSSSQISYQFNNASDVGTWTVRVNNPNGQSSNTVSFTVGSSATLPGAPQSLAASGGNGVVGLAWNAPSSNGGATITNYRVFRGTTSSNRQIVTSGGCANLGAVLGCADTSVTNGQSYNYIVSAVNSVGQGPPSNSATATPSAPNLPGAPQNLAASGGNGVVGLAWNAPSSNGGATITSYRVFRGTNSSNRLIVTSGGCANLGAVLGCADTSVTNGQTYDYIVSAVNSAGQGPPSNSVIATPMSSTLTISSVSPNPFPASNSNQILTINGSGFSSSSTVTLRSPFQTYPNHLTMSKTANQIVMQVNLGTTPAEWTVEVLNGSQSSGQFPFQVTAPTGAPAINNISPSSYAASNSNQTMTVNGSNFQNGATLTFDPPTGANIPSSASKLTFGSSSQISYQFNNGSDVGTWMLRVNNPNGQSSSWLSFNVTGFGSPTLSGLAWNTTPTHLQNFSGNITGTGFIPNGTRVFFCVNGTNTCYEHPQAGIIVNNATNVSVSNVNLGAGSYQVYVQTSGGASNRSSAFTVDSVQANPRLTVSPTSGPLGTAFRFTGSNFTRNSTASLNVSRPNGSQFSGGTYAIDSGGSVSFVITSQSSDATGPWSFSLTDTAGKQSSATAQYTSAQPSGTDAMTFIADVTIPDNSQLTTGSTFVKTWRLKNIGTTTWTNYTAVFVSAPSNGNPSLNLSTSAATSISVPSAAPNQTVDLSISMRAPSAGTYYSYWQLQNASGSRFGVQFYVKIRVVPQQGNALGFGTQTGRGGTNDSIPANSGRNADPVNTATGNYNFEATDLRVPGRGIDLVFSRFYNSQDSTLGPLGTGWSHAFNIYLADITPSTASLHYSDGKVLNYMSQAGTNNFISSYPGYYDTLVRNDDGTWTLKKPDQRNYQFDSSGRLTRVVDRNNNQVTLNYNGSNLSQVTDTVGRTFDFTYSGSLLTTITDPIGRILRFNYDNANLTSFQDARGNFNTYQYDASNRLTRIVDGRQNNLLVNTYDGNSRVATQTNGRGNQWRFAYNADGSTSVFDPLNAETKYLHDTNFNMGRTVDRNSNNLNVLYDEVNNRAQMSDLNNNYSSFVYDPSGNVISATNAALNSRQATYDSNNNPTRVTDELGKSTQLAYDAKGNLTSITDAQNNTSSTTYDSFGQPATIVDSNGNVTTNTYDGQGNLISVKDSLNNITTYGYDAVGRRISMTDARGKITRYTYDLNDNLLTTTDPLGGVTTYTYDANNNRTSTRDPRGNTTIYAYDENNSLVKETDAKGFFVQHTYDTLDRRLSTRDKRGGATNFGYDNEGRLITVTDALGHVTRYAYDANGNRTQVTDARNQTTTFAYDVLNRVTHIQDALGNSIQKQYDATGRLAKETDPRGNATQFNYDAVGNLSQVTDAAGGTAKYSYDKNRNRITQTDPNNRTSNLAYDKLNRLVSSANPLSHASSYTYDEVGNRISHSDANGRTTRYAYDGNNQLSSITYADNSTVQFTRDANGNITRMVDSLGTSSFVYDELNRVTSATDPFGKTIGYQYDESGNVTRLTYPDGKQVTYQFDANNQMTSFTDWAAKTTTFQYDSTSILTRVTYPNGVVTSFTYDNAGRLIAKSDSGISSYSFTLDKNGNRTSATITQPLANRVHNNSQNYTYDAANRIQTAGPTTFTFDNNGNMTTKTEAGVVTSYVYDFENRLASVGNVSQYFYNGEGVRFQKIENGKTTRYVVDTNRDLSQVLCETDASGAITAYYVYGVGLAYKVDPNGTHYYYSFDPLGSTIAMTNDAAAVVNSYAYDPFGRATNKTETTPNTFQFLGLHGVAQDNNGLHYIRARYYMALLGRFISADPLEGNPINLQTINRYAYSLNNPIRFIDTSGLSAKDVVVDFLRSEFSTEIKEVLKELVKEATANIVNRRGFSWVGDVAFITNRVIDKLPLLEIGYEAGKRLGQDWDNPNMDWSEKAARASLTVGLEAVEQLIQLIPVVGIPLSAAFDVAVDRNFERMMNLLKRQIGERLANVIYPSINTYGTTSGYRTNLRGPSK